MHQPLNKTIAFIATIVFCVCSIGRVSAYNMRNMSNEEGLANSAILSLCQDSNGLLWIGTCDGVDIYDGATIYPLSSLLPSKSISGNIIEGMIESSPGEMWIKTNLGLNRVILKDGTLNTFPKFQGRELIAIDSSKRLFLLDEDNTLYTFDISKNDEFVKIKNIELNHEDVLEMAFNDNTLIVFSKSGIGAYRMMADDNGSYNASSRVIISKAPLIFASHENGKVFTITHDGYIEEFSTKTFDTKRLTSISNEMAQRGAVSDIINDAKGNLFISFVSDGAIRCSKAQKYESVDLNIKVGVFCLSRSVDQNVVWIGSDCQGLFSYSEDACTIRSISFDMLDNLISHPVRALWVDGNNSLWVGTKGDGLLQIDNFDTTTSKMGKKKLYTSSNSLLYDNMVFAFANSSRNLLWIGTEKGVNYYSYTTQRIHAVDSEIPLNWIHGIYEENDSSLWLATVGQGVINAKIVETRANELKLTNIKQYTLDNGKTSSNYFFTLAVDEHGKPVFGNRGVGAFIIDEKADTLKQLRLNNKFDTRTVNDVFAIIKEDTIMWLGTGHGLVRKTPNREELYFGSENGLVNSTVHTLLKEHEGNIWLSTNQGLVRFSPDTHRWQTFDENFGVEILEFSDGASTRASNGSLLFGGTTGIAIVTENDNKSNFDYESTPEIYPIGLSIGGRRSDLSDYYTSTVNNQLELNYDQNYFEITFTAPDFKYGYNRTYLYSLDGTEWLNNGNNSNISFTDMNHGKHKLYVKYINRQLGCESNVFSMMISIRPPWYLSQISKLLYGLLAICIVYITGKYAIKTQRQRQTNMLEDMKQRHKMEIYEEKLKFFTNITHEFCTPLALIYGTCERILTNEKTDSHTKKYMGIVKSNAERLNNLIQEIIDFRRINTGHDSRKVRRIDVSALCNETIASFGELADKNDIVVENNITPHIVWNTDMRCMSKIVGNLLSNAFKYTSPNGTIRVFLEEVDDKLRLKVYNTGKGVREEDKSVIFNRYAILDNVEENSIKGLSSRNGLGMAICHSMVELLEGTITIESEVDRYACFIVELPILAIDDNNESIINYPSVTQPIHAMSSNTKDTAKHNRQRILIVDDNVEMLDLLSESLSDYDVTTATDSQTALNLITESMPNIIITDVMMPGSNGLEFTKQIKANKYMMHIPVIILSAKNANEEKIEGIKAGADVYIGKPFSLQYLRAVIERISENSIKLKEYYNSSASIYEYSGGKLLDRESKEFIDKITEYVDANIDNPDLSVDSIAEHLFTSPRNLYRKMAKLELLPPNDFVKNRRVELAAKLLRTTTLTTQEVIFRCGFSSRSHFYKEFQKRFATTPKVYREQSQQEINLQ